MSGLWGYFHSTPKVSRRRGGDTRCAPVSDLGIFQEALFSYINAFVDSTDVQTSKSVQLIMGIWRADHMLPMWKWRRNGRKISHAQVLALIVIISKQQQWRLLFCAFARRNAGGSHVESSHRRFPSGGWRNNKWFVDLHCQCQITLISSINANPILCELFPWSPTWMGGGATDSWLHYLSLWLILTGWPLYLFAFSKINAEFVAQGS